MIPTSDLPACSAAFWKYGPFRPRSSWLCLATRRSPLDVSDKALRVFGAALSAQMPPTAA